MAIPQFKLNTNDPSTWGEIEGTQEQTKRRLVVWKGRTTDATPTEIFLNGESGSRLKVHDTGNMVVHPVTAVALSGVAASSGGVIWSTPPHIINVGGTVTMTTAVVAAKLGGASFTGITTPVSLAVDSTNKALGVTVTGIAATTIDWEVQAWVLELSSDAGQLGV